MYAVAVETTRRERNSCETCVSGAAAVGRKPLTNVETVGYDLVNAMLYFNRWCDALLLPHALVERIGGGLRPQRSIGAFQQYVVCTPERH